MKKRSLLSIILLSLILTSCSNAIENKEFQEGLNLMENSKYEEAIESFNLAKESGYENISEVDQIIKTIKRYNIAKNSFDKGYYDYSEKLLNEIYDYENLPIKEDIDSLKNEISDLHKKKENIALEKKLEKEKKIKEEKSIAAKKEIEEKKNKIKEKGKNIVRNKISEKNNEKIEDSKENNTKNSKENNKENKKENNLENRNKEDIIGEKSKVLSVEDAKLKLNNYIGISDEKAYIVHNTKGDAIKDDEKWYFFEIRYRDNDEVDNWYFVSSKTGEITLEI